MPVPLPWYPLIQFHIMTWFHKPYEMIQEMLGQDHGFIISIFPNSSFTSIVHSHHDVGTKLNPKFVTKFSSTLLLPFSPGNLKWLMLSGMLWIRRTTMFTMFGYGRCLGWEYREEVTTWPRQKHGQPNELKLHTWNTRCFTILLFLLWNKGEHRAAKEARADEEVALNQNLM